MIRVVKIGGGVIDDDDKLNAVLDSIAQSPDPTVLIHGGGRLATDLAKRLGVEQTMVDGRRITDLDTLQIVTMTYAGWVNKRIVAQLQARGINAIGATGADADLIRSKVRPSTPIDFGFVGDPVSVNVSALKTLSELSGSGPTCVVLAPITHDGKGTLLNTNADTIAADVALARAADSELVFAFEHVGVTRTLLAKLSQQEAQSMIESGEIHTGMLPKIQNALRAVAGGVQRVRICRYDAIDTEEGTWIS